MITYPASFLASRTRPCAAPEVARRIGWVRVRALDIIKANIIRTPMANGRVDYDQVPAGASIWVTVTDESSPMHGRPILITKRPDGQFALEGGSGTSHWHDDGDERSKRIAARRHLVLGVGKVKPSKVDEDVARRVKERTAKQQQLAEQMAQRRAAFREAAGATRQALGLPEDTRVTRAEKATYNAFANDLFRQVGADSGDAARYASAVASELGQIKSRFTAAHALRRVERARAMLGGPLLNLEEPGVGPDEQMAAQPPEGGAAIGEAARLDADVSAMVQAIMQQSEALGRPLTDAEAQMAAQTEGDRQLQAALAPPEEPPVGGSALPEEAPPPDPAMGPEAQPFPEEGQAGDDLAGLASFGQQAQALRDAGIEPGDPLGLGDQPPPEPHATVPLVDLPEWTTDQKEHAQAAVDAFRREMELRGAIKRTRQDLAQYAGLRLTTPAAIDRQMIEASGVSPQEFNQLMDHYRQIHRIPSRVGFYEALTPHWNDNLSYADGLSGFVEQGAIGAATGILGQPELLGDRLDVAKLVRGIGIEGAAYALATDIIREFAKDPKRIDQLIQGLTDYNAGNQQATEDRALRRHEDLVRQGRLIEDMMARRELGGSAREMKGAGTRSVQSIAARAAAEGTRLLAENIVAQRQNLGTALGSMQMAATILHALESTRRLAGKQDPEAQFVTLYYGDNEDFRDEAANSLGAGQGALVPGKDPNLGYSLKVDTMRLGRYVNRLKGERQRDLLYQKLKESDHGVKVENGQEVVPGYKVPFFRDTFTDADGEEKPVVMRRNQRNDIEWLRKSGGGVITRTTGAGKTNTTLGFYAWKIHENPNYHGVAVVPNRRGEQWQKEAQNFTNLNTTEIPDNASKEEVIRLAQQFAHGENGVLIIGHRQATRNAEILHALYGNGKLHGMAIDEPQELQGSSREARLTAGAQEVMKVGSTQQGNRRVPDPEFNRIALTATPAKRKPVQAYDLVNWTNPGALGPRTKFHSAFSGFAEGTSAADDALQNMIGREIAPFVSGDEEVNHPFPLNVKDHLVLRTPQQVERQKEIEATSRREVNRLSDRRYEDLVARGRDPYEAREQANKEARQQVGQWHRENIDSGQTDDSGRIIDASGAAKGNAKIRAMLKEVKKAKPGDKHVIFVDGQNQRAVVTQALRDQGYKPDAIKQITQGTGQREVESRKRAWKHGGANVPFLIIDKSSAAGHNLQEGDHLHVMAAPADAATLLQAQGRVARGNKRTATTIHTYRTHDSPFETRDWEGVERGMKLMAATSPGLARKYLENATKARDAALRGMEPGDTPDEAVAKSRAIVFRTR